MENAKKKKKSIRQVRDDVLGVMYVIIKNSHVQ